MGNDRESLPRQCIERGWAEFKQRSLYSASSFTWFTQQAPYILRGCFKLRTVGTAAAGNEKPPQSLSRIDRSAASWPDAAWAWAARGSLLHHQQPVPSAGGFLLLSWNLFRISLLTSLKQQLSQSPPLYDFRWCPKLSLLPRFSTFSITQGVPLCSCGTGHIPLLLSQMWVSSGSFLTCPYLPQWPWHRCTHSTIYSEIITHKALTGQLCTSKDHHCKTSIMTLHTPDQIFLSIVHLLKGFIESVWMILSS